MATPHRLRKMPSAHGLSTAYKRLSIPASPSSGSNSSTRNQSTKNEANVGRRIARKLVQVIQPTSKPSPRQYTANVSPLVSTFDRYAEGMAEQNLIDTRHDHQLRMQPQSGAAEQQPAHLNSQPLTGPHSIVDVQVKALPPLPHEQNHASATDSMSIPTVNLAEITPEAKTIDLGEYRHHPHDTIPSLPPASFTEESLAKRLGITDAASISLHSQHAPLVTHTIIATPTHEILSEQITREIHEHHVYHRVLPVTIGREILPARYYVQEHDGSLVELPESSVLEAQLFRNVDRAVEEYASKPAHRDVPWADTAAGPAGDNPMAPRDVGDGRDDLRLGVVADWHGQMDTMMNTLGSRLPTRDVFFHFVGDDVQPVEQRLHV